MRSVQSGSCSVSSYLSIVPTSTIPLGKHTDANVTETDGQRIHPAVYAAMTRADHQGHQCKGRDHNITSSEHYQLSAASSRPTICTI
jgi:hypothetical protein